MSFEFHNDLPLMQENIQDAFTCMKESIDKSLLAINHTLGDYMTADFMEKVQLFYKAIFKEIENAENYYMILESGEVLTKKFLEFLTSFEKELNVKIDSMHTLVIKDEDGSDYNLNKGFNVIVAKAIYDVSNKVLTEYAERLSDLSILIETQEKMLREKDNGFN